MPLRLAQGARRWARRRGALLLSISIVALAMPSTAEHDFVVKDFRFQSGETLAEVRMHYRTFGTPRRDAAGRLRNAVLVLHGSSGDATQVLASSFSAPLVGAGQPLDARVWREALRAFPKGLPTR